MGVKVDPRRQKIEVEGKEISFPSLLYFAFYKPQGCLSVLHDPRGRPTVGDFFRDLPVRVYPAGRLDWDAEGLIILTNDGELAYILTHPRFGVEKVYRVVVEGKVGRREIERLKKGVLLDGRKTIPRNLKIIRQLSHQTLLEVVLGEGRYHEIKRIFGEIGCVVRGIKRIRVGPVSLGELQPGKWRVIRGKEKERLLALKELKREGLRRE